MTTMPSGSLLNAFVSTEWGACLVAAPANSGTGLSEVTDDLIFKDSFGEFGASSHVNIVP